MGEEQGGRKEREEAGGGGVGTQAVKRGRVRGEEGLRTVLEEGNPTFVENGVKTLLRAAGGDSR